MLAAAGRREKTKAGGDKVSSLINVTGCIIWLRVEWLLPAGCQFRSPWANYRSRAVCYLHPKCLGYAELCSFKTLDRNGRLFGDHNYAKFRFKSVLPFLKRGSGFGMMKSSGDGQW